MKYFVLALLFCAFPFFTIAAEEIRVMYNSNYYPLEFTNDRGRPDGFVIDLIYALARESAFEVYFDEGSWQQGEKLLFNGDFDFIPGYRFDSGNDSIITSKVLFSVPFCLLHRKNMIQARKKDFDNRIPLFSSGDSSEPYLANLFESENIIRTKSWSDAVKALYKGYGDFAVISTLHKDLLFDEYAESLALLENYRPELPYVLYSTTWNKNRLEKMNNSLSIIRASGEYDRIYNKWFRDNRESLITETPDRRRNLIILFIAAIVFIIVMITIRKRKVKT